MLVGSWDSNNFSRLKVAMHCEKGKVCEEVCKGIGPLSLHVLSFNIQMPIDDLGPPEPLL